MLFLSARLFFLFEPVFVHMLLPFPELLLHLLHILLGVHDISHNLGINLAHVILEFRLDVGLVQIILHELRGDAHSGRCAVSQVKRYG